MRYFITFPGEAGNVDHFGGTPYNLGMAMRAIGQECHFLSLTADPVVKTARIIRGGVNLLAGKGRGGFHYSDFFLNRIWKGAPTFRSGDVLINFFQLYGRPAWAEPARKVFYLDMTLNQYFAGYDPSMHSSIQKRSLAREKEGYNRADLVIGRSQWASDSFANDYDVAPDRIRTVLPGANVSDDFIRYLRDAPIPAPHGRLRFLFMGKDPVRKGLPRFFDALRVMPELRDKVEMHVIGLTQDQIPAADRELCPVHIHGFVSKKDTRAFCDIMLGCDVGILLSYAEAGGFALREFQLAGLAVIAPNVGGSPEWVEPGTAVLVHPQDDAARIAALLKDLVDHPDKVAAMQAASRERRDTIAWTRTARNICNEIEALG